MLKSNLTLILALLLLNGGECKTVPSRMEEDGQERPEVTSDDTTSPDIGNDRLSTSDSGVPNSDSVLPPGNESVQSTDKSLSTSVNGTHANLHENDAENEMETEIFGTGFNATTVDRDWEWVEGMGPGNESQASNNILEILPVKPDDIGLPLFPRGGTGALDPGVGTVILEPELDDLAGGTFTLESEIGKLGGGTGTLEPEIGKLGGGTGTLEPEIGKLGGGTVALESEIGKLGGGTVSLESEIGKLGGGTVTLEPEIGKLGRGTGTLEPEIGKLGGGTVTLEPEIGKLGGGTGTLEPEIGKLGGGTVTLEPEIGKLGGGTGTLESEIGKLGGGTGTLEPEIGKLGGGTVTLEPEIGKLGRGTGTLEPEIGKLGGGTGTLEPEIGKLGGGTVTLEPEIGKLGGGTVTLESEIGKLGGGTGTLKSEIGKLGGGTVTLESEIGKLGGGTVTIEPEIWKLGGGTVTLEPEEQYGAVGSTEPGFGGENGGVSPELYPNYYIEDYIEESSFVDIMYGISQSVCPYLPFCKRGPLMELPESRISCCEPCSCADDCDLAGTCCADAEALKRDRRPEVVPCISVEGLINENRGFYADADALLYKVVDTCKQNVASDEENHASKCTRNAETLEELWPVSNAQNGRVYKNKHCAACNGVADGDVTVWELFETNCTEVLWKRFESVDDRNTYVFTNCPLKAYPPITTVVDIATCNYMPERKCTRNFGKNKPSFKQELASSLCNETLPSTINSNIYFDIMGTSVTYSDLFCVYCDMPEHATLCTEESMRTLVFKKKPLMFGEISDGAPPPLALSAMVPLVGLRKDGCQSYQIGDPFIGSCNRLICPTGFFPYQGLCERTLTDGHNVGLVINFVIRESPESDVFIPPRDSEPEPTIHEALIELFDGLMSSECDYCDLSSVAGVNVILGVTPNAACPLHNIIQVVATMVNQTKQLQFSPDKHDIRVVVNSDDTGKAYYSCNKAFVHLDSTIDVDDGPDCLYIVKSLDQLNTAGIADSLLRTILSEEQTLLLETVRNSTAYDQDADVELRLCADEYLALWETTSPSCRPALSTYSIIFVSVFIVSEKVKIHLFSDNYH